jgi:hypothetical protein
VWRGSGLCSLGGVGCIKFYEGFKDFVGKDGMVIVEMVAGCMYDVYMESRNGVQMCFFLYLCYYNKNDTKSFKIFFRYSTNAEYMISS